MRTDLFQSGDPRRPGGAGDPRNHGGAGAPAARPDGAGAGRPLGDQELVFVKAEINRQGPFPPSSILLTIEVEKNDARGSTNIRFQRVLEISDLFPM